MQKRTQEAHAEGTVVRKLWIGEAARYRDHLLRLDAESRHSRFGGGVSDDFIIAYVKTTYGLGSVVHGFFADPQFADHGAFGVGLLRSLLHS